MIVNKINKFINFKEQKKLTIITNKPWGVYFRISIFVAVGISFIYSGYYQFNHETNIS